MRKRMFDLMKSLAPTDAAFEPNFHNAAPGAAPGR